MKNTLAHANNLPAVSLIGWPLSLVSEAEVQSLGRHLEFETLPLDFESKLQQLARGDLCQAYVERNCRSLASLVVAAWHGQFRNADPETIAYLLKVLAYVRKHDDAVPDFLPNGYLDDYAEVRRACTSLNPLLDQFKTWRLRHQVASLWPAAPRCTQHH